MKPKIQRHLKEASKRLWQKLTRVFYSKKFIKPIKDWTLEDCDSKEYWKTLFEWGTIIKLKAIEGDFYLGWESSQLIYWTEGNKVVANKMLYDLIEYKYLYGGRENKKVIYAKPIWVQRKEEPRRLTEEQQATINEAWKIFHAYKPKLGQSNDTQNPK